MYFGNFELWFGVKRTGSSENIYLPEYLNRTEENLLITTKHTKPKKCIGQKYFAKMDIMLNHCYFIAQFE